MKRFVVECIGTFLLTLAVAFSANPLAVGFMFLAIVMLGHAISGAYYNPAVVLTGWLRGTLSLTQSAWYIAAQLLGAAAACALFYFSYGDLFLPPLIAPSLSISALLEFALTALFVVMIFFAARSATSQWAAPYIGLTAGLTLSSAGFVGALCNPAIALTSVGVAVAQGYTEGITDIIIVHVCCALVAGLLAHFALNYIKPATQQN